MSAPAAVTPDPVTLAEVIAAARRLGPPDALVAGVLDLAGARALSFDALLRLASIEWSGEVATACVECTDRPRLLLSPAFVERWCGTRERLAALLLHELAHVSMGHTRLYPRPGAAQNLACDAVINRELLDVAGEAGADAPRFAGLFEAYYRADQAPWFLLRPPPGWPASPDWSASAECPEALREIHRRLYATYPSRDRSWRRVESPHARHTVLYGEIVAALRESGIVVEVGGDAAVLARLLGGHGTNEREQAALTGGRDAAAAEALAEVLAPITGRLAGRGGDPFVHQVARAARRTALERALAALLRRAFTEGGAERGRPLDVARPTRTVDPGHDRRAPARVGLARAFGAPRPLLFDGTVAERRPAPRDALVYLDASGSMFSVLPALVAALVPLRRLLRPRLHAFSTTVEPVRPAEFDRGRLPTTGGTSIAPVLEHLLAQAHAGIPGRQAAGRVALILTDGYFDAPSATLARQVRATGIRIHLGVAGPGPLHDRAGWIASATRLPMP